MRTCIRINNIYMYLFCNIPAASVLNEPAPTAVSTISAMLNLVGITRVDGMCVNAFAIANIATSTKRNLILIDCLCV